MTEARHSATESELAVSNAALQDALDGIAEAVKGWEWVPERHEVLRIIDEAERAMPDYYAWREKYLYVVRAVRRLLSDCEDPVVRGSLSLVEVERRLRRSLEAIDGVATNA